MEERIRFVVRASQGGKSMTALCREFGVSRQSGYKWLRRYQQAGRLRELREHSRRPESSPGKTSEEVEDEVEALRREYGFGSRKLQRLLKEHRGVHLGRSTIDRILRRRGLIEEGVLDGRPAVHRFERCEPNELVQMDFKGQYPLRGGGWCYPLSLLDDHSRFVLGLHALSNQRTAGVQESLVGTFEQCGVPDAMLVDHGTPWWSPTSPGGLTKLSVWLIRQDVRLHFSGYRHPQTQGKVERFHRSLEAGLKHRGMPETLEGFVKALAEQRRIYNEVRPHEALGMETPASRYRPSRRSYVANPRAWEYPPGSTVVRINTAGALWYRQRQYFVCEALASRHVAVEEFSGKLLVTYRQMPIREIDLETGRTEPVMEPVARRSATSFGRG